MKTCFQIAECSFSSAKIMENERKTSSLLDFFAEMQLIFCKDSPFFCLTASLSNLKTPDFCHDCHFPVILFL